MTVTTAQGLGTSPQGAVNSTGGEVVTQQDLYAGSMAVDAMASLTLPNHTNFGTTSGTTGVATLTTGYDPVVVVALSTRLRSVGQIWPLTLLG
jgi:hypothetical protein